MNSNMPVNDDSSKMEAVSQSSQIIEINASESNPPIETPAHVDVSEHTDLSGNCDNNNDDNEFHLRFNMFINFDHVIDDITLFKHILPDFQKDEEAKKLHFLRYVKRSMTHFGTNTVYKKYRNNIFGTLCLLENNLPMFNPFLQLRGFKNASAFLHAYWNNLDKDIEYVGFSEFNLAHKQIYDDDFLDQEKKTFYFKYNDDDRIVCENSWSPYMKEVDADYILSSYNEIFQTSYTIDQLEGLPESKDFCIIYPNYLFQKIGFFISKFADKLPSHKQNTKHGLYYQYFLRCLSLCHAIQIVEGRPYKNIEATREIVYQNIAIASVHETTNTDSSMNETCDASWNTVPFVVEYVDHDVYDCNNRVKYIDNITTTEIPEKCFPKLEENSVLNASTCKAILIEKETNTIFLCDNVCVNNESALLLTDFMENSEFKLLGKGLDPQNPRLIHWKGSTWIVSDIASEGTRSMTISKVEYGEEVNTLFKPIQLRLPEQYDHIEKVNWRPFVKDQELYFICSFSPLIIAKVKELEDVENEIDCIELEIVHEGPLDLPYELKGGSNFVYFEGFYYIGQCYSEDGDKKYVHTVVLDTLQWRLIHVSKPLMFTVPLNKLNDFKVIEHTAILDYKDAIPVSMNRNTKNKFMTTVSFDNKVTYMLELCVDI